MINVHVKCDTKNWVIILTIYGTIVTCTLIKQILMVKYIKMKNNNEHTFLEHCG